MAVYKVPQDVEADDKLLGPFSFRQFVYLIVVALCIGLAYLLYKVFIGLIIIPMPFILFFGALALPLKKDQPMEAYLGAMFSFYILKPRKRFWQPNGLNALVEITAPKQVEPDRVKHLSEDEAKEKLGYLTNIVESRGWAVRGVNVASQGINPQNSTIYADQTSEPDVFDDANAESQRFGQMIEQQHQQTVDQLRDNFQQQMAATPITPVQSQVVMPQQQNYPNTAPIDNQKPVINPYPPAMNQSVIQPLEQVKQSNPAPVINTPVQTEQLTSTSIESLPPDIINLAKDSDGLTVAAVARQADRLEKEHGLTEGEEVDIKLH